MAICSYLVLPESGGGPALSRKLNAFPGCEAVCAEDTDILVLVTETADQVEEGRLRDRIEALDEVRALVLTFGEVEVS